jgi:hypothetical protein
VEVSAVEGLLARLTAVRKSGAEWLCKCPAHDDQHASLSVAEGKDGRALVYCHAGCSVAAICRAVGLKVSDLFPTCGRRQNPPATKKTRSIVANRAARRPL